MNALIRPLPHHDYVENYIKAFYLSENDLETWLVQHNVSVCWKLKVSIVHACVCLYQEYSTKELQSLVLCGSGGLLNKKSKQKLLSLLEK